MTNLIILKDVPKKYKKIINTFQLDFNDGLNSLEEVINDNAPFQLEDCIVDGDWLIPINNNIQGFNIKILNTEKLFLNLLELSIWLHQEIDKVETRDKIFKLQEEAKGQFYSFSIDLDGFVDDTKGFTVKVKDYEKDYNKLINFLKTSYKNNQVISKGQIKRLLIQLGEEV